jgi:Family of unknown function (DUF6065)
VSDRLEAAREAAAAVPELVCYPLEPDPPAIEPARAAREWMDRTHQRYAYRCLPLSIANASGWEILAPIGFEASWSGGEDKAAIIVRSAEDPERVKRLATSHFAHGILTLHTGYLFRTSPGWALWVRGAPNSAKRNLVPLDGVVETDWLDFPFTMNWRFTRAGTARFEKGEPFCFITPVPHAVIDRIEPELRPLESDPELKAAFEARSESRASFNAGLHARDPDTVARGWQRHYMRGEDATGRQADFHLTKRRVRPVSRR